MIDDNGGGKHGGIGVILWVVAGLYGIVFILWLLWKFFKAIGLDVPGGVLE